MNLHHVPAFQSRAARKALLGLLFLTGVSWPLFASTGEYGAGLTHEMTVLAVQLGIIIFAARAFGTLFRRRGLPSLVGELAAGILIGPYLLGAVPVPLLPEGVFPLVAGAVPVTTELYGFATIAAIIMLFTTGLETDLAMFLRFSVKGSVIGVGGALLAFVLGASVISVGMGLGLGAPQSIFLGVLSMAASVGIPARILSEARRIDSPEGVTIISSAVVQDVLAIVGLAVALGVIAATESGNGGVDWAEVARIFFLAIGVWLGFTALGLIFARRIGEFLKGFKSATVFSVLALGFSFLLAGIFEMSGLAMIIGAYVMGLTLSKTDIAYAIQENMEPLTAFFVPIFFTVMGMLVNIRILFSWQVLLLGLAFAVASNIGKIVGSGVPALLMGFNRLGALRIGSGLIPRGEVALIIAGIGVSGGILDERLFGVAVLLVLLSTIAGSPNLKKILERDGAGTRHKFTGSGGILSRFEFPNESMTELVEAAVLKEFRSEGFFAHRIELEETVYRMRKEDIFFSFTVYSDRIVFSSDPESVGFIKTVVYEALLDLHRIVEELKTVAKPTEMGREISSETGHSQFAIARYSGPRCVKLRLAGSTKEAVIEELVDTLFAAGRIQDKERVLADALSRERVLSTGMQHGIAVPHAKSEGASRMSFAIGFARDGIDFESVDGEPTYIVVLIVSPKSNPGPHLQLLSTISGVLKEEESRWALLSMIDEHKVISYLQEEAVKKHSRT